MTTPVSLLDLPGHARTRRLHVLARSPRLVLRALPLVELGKLRDAAKLRGLDDLGLFSRDPWETLDREGILVPVAYARHPGWVYDQPGCLDDGDLKIREEAGYLPWEAQSKEAEEMYGERAGLQVLYHHWQLLWLAELQRLLTPGVPWGNLGDGLEVFFEMRAKMATVPQPVPGDALRASADAHRATELLLIRVQNVFFPFERGDPRHSNWLGSHVPGLTNDGSEWAIAQLGELNYAALAKECAVTPEDLRGIYEGLVYKALRIDPARDLFDLIDQVRRARRERLKASARLALDYYDAARVIRSWHGRITDDLLPDIDEYLGWNGTTYKESHFGTLDVRGNRAVLPVLLEDYGVYPWRVQLIGEGDSEIVALREIVEEGHGLSFETLGIAVVDMGGADIPAKAERLLGALRGYANYFLLVFDNEGTARAPIEELVRGNVIEGVSDQQRAAILRQAAEAAKQIDDPEARRDALRAARQHASHLHEEPGAAPEFLLWRENFEADNFTPREMFDVLQTYARQEVEIEDLRLSLEEVEQRLDERRSVGEDKAIASVLLELAEEKDERLLLSKPNFARWLARFALEHPEHDGKTRPILELAEHLVQLTWADRRLSGELRGH